MGFYDDSRGLPRSIQYGRAFRRLRPTEFALNLWDKEHDTRYHDSFQHIWYATTPAVGGAGTSGGAIAVGDTAMWLAEFDVTEEFRASKPYRIFNYSQWKNDEEEFRFPSLLKHQDPNRPSINEENGTREFMYARLGETYLIAAEAYLGMGNPAAAVPHINEVRRRAARTGSEDEMEITAADVDIDFILDERGRELIGEVNRWYDLVRTGTFLERVLAHNRKAAAAGFVREHHALRPIPQSQIDAVENDFPQNPGY
jgi:starch-binding outer membrane protein, SusD/RagB family